MTPRPVECDPPAGSLIADRLAGADFFDAWCVESDDVEASALAHFLRAAERTPRWVEACMSLRNRAVALVGLKHLGSLSGLAPGKPAEAHEPGDRVGIFTLFEQTFDEALLGDRDRHLDVVLSVHRSMVPGGGRVRMVVTTVVHVKNLLGRIYMVPVRPMHRLIAPAVMRSLGAAPIRSAAP